MLNKYQFTKENLDNSLKALAKEYKKLIDGKMPAEIILVGGAAVLANYGFRDVTYDIDAVIEAASAMDDAIKNTAALMDLPSGWLNADFKKTSSYSVKLIEHSKYYKTFSNILLVRTVAAEYLVAMKLMSGRKYKNDISDIVGILAEQKRYEKPLSFESIDKAVIELYGSWDKIHDDSKDFIQKLLAEENYDELYAFYRNEEILNQDIPIDFNEKYPNVTTASNVSSILSTLKKKL